MNIAKEFRNHKMAPIKIAVLGGGISGLASAYFLKKKCGNKARIALFESQNRVGGWIQTVEQDGFLFELGPHSLRITDGDVVCQLLEELGLQKEIHYASAHARNRYLFLNGKLQKIPNLYTLFSLFPSLCKELFVRRSTQEETVAQFFSRRFSLAIVDSYVDPIIKGIYGGDPHLLSMKCCLPRLVHLEQKYGSLIRGLVLERQHPWKMITLANGLESLVKTLAASLTDCIHLSTPVNKLSFTNGKAFVNDEQFDHVVSSLPGPQVAKLLNTFSPESASFAVVNLGFKNFKLPFKGFGYLVPAKEKQDILGVIFDSENFPNQKGACRLAVMAGGWQQSELVDLPDCHLLNLVLKNLSCHFRQEIKPDTVLIHRAKEAVPQYFLGHEDRMNAIRTQYKFHPIQFIGNAFQGVSVSDCIVQAKNSSNILILNQKINS